MGNTVFETIWKLQDILQYTLFFLPILISKQNYENFMLIQIWSANKNTFSSQNTERKQHKTKSCDNLQPTCFYVWTSLQKQILVSV